MYDPDRQARATKCREDITLKSGRVVTHARNSLGSQDATLTDGGTMTDAEWLDYCEQVRDALASSPRPGR